jgi:hypothetical protein
LVRRRTTPMRPDTRVASHELWTVPIRSRHGLAVPLQRLLAHLTSAESLAVLARATRLRLSSGLILDGLRLTASPRALGEAEGLTQIGDVTAHRRPPAHRRGHQQKCAEAAYDHD